MRYRPEGVVSVFLCGVLLIIIVFSCTIIDATRIHIAKGQAERALLYASRSILASYDSHLQSQYGIFGKDFSSNQTIQYDISDYIQSTLNPKSIPKYSNSIINFLNPTEDKLNLYNFNIKLENIYNVSSILNSDYIKLQILEFMKYRAPFLALEPFIEKLDTIKRSSKTTEIIMKKDEMVSHVEELQNSFCRLEKLIDGIVIDEKTSKISLYENYVKKLITTNNKNQTIYNEKEMPIASYRDLLSENLWWIDDTLINYKQAILICEEAINNIFTSNNNINTLLKEIENLQLIISSLQLNPENNSHAVKEYYKEKSVLENLVVLEKEKIQENINEFKASHTNIYKDFIPQLKLLIGDYVPLQQFGIRGILEEALLEIEAIKNRTPIIAEKLADLKKELNGGKDEYMKEVCEAIEDEIKRYEKILGIDDHGEVTIINNLLAMTTVIEKNIEVLSEIESDIEFLSENKNNLYNYWFNKNIFNEEDFNLYELKRRLNIQFELDINTVDFNIQAEILNKLVAIENKLDKYNRNLYFNYGEINTENKFSFSYFIEMAKGIIPSTDLQGEEIIILDNNLPSIYINNIEDYSYTYEVEEISIKKSNYFLDILKNIGNGIAEEIIDFRDTIYINEYILGMFRNAAEDKEDSYTLNNYDKTKHYLNYEVEYIISGNTSDFLNLVTVVGLVFGVRTGLNIISIISDSYKMNIITNLGNSIAGWWTLGVGSIVISVILTLVWAMLEAAYDIQALLKGNKIPIIKDTHSWKTDILNGISDIFTEGISKEDSHLPSLSYQDYLRLFLLSGFVDEKIKLFRIMDLIQINISKERDEKIELVNYISKFETEAFFEVNLIFFNLPFMPSKIKDVGNKMSFKKNVAVSY